MTATEEVEVWHNEAKRLTKGIQDYLDGNYPNPRKSRPNQCQHGTQYWEECAQCDGEYFAKLLAADRQAVVEEMTEEERNGTDRNIPCAICGCLKCGHHLGGCEGAGGNCTCPGFQYPNP